MKTPSTWPPTFDLWGRLDSGLFPLRSMVPLRTTLTFRRLLRMPQCFLFDSDELAVTSKRRSLKARRRRPRRHKLRKFRTKCGQARTNCVRPHDLIRDARAPSPRTSRGEGTAKPPVSARRTQPGTERSWHVQNHACEDWRLGIGASLILHHV